MPVPPPATARPSAPRPPRTARTVPALLALVLLAFALAGCSTSTLVRVEVDLTSFLPEGGFDTGFVPLADLEAAARVPDADGVALAELGIPDAALEEIRGLEVAGVLLVDLAGSEGSASLEVALHVSAGGDPFAAPPAAELGFTALPDVTTRVPFRLEISPEATPEAHAALASGDAALGVAVEVEVADADAVRLRLAELSTAVEGYPLAAIVP